MPASLAFTCGDPAGIGPEVIASWLSSHADEAAGVTVLGPASWLDTLKTSARKLPVGMEGFAAVPGKPSGEGALVAWAALERAAAGALSGEFSGVVTAPVSKAELAAIGWPYPGHTEFFAARWGGEPTMAFCGGKLNVGLLTWHIPLKEVPQHLGAANLERAVAACEELARAAGAPKDKPVRIAVCGLNPHAGEGGLLGTEERDLIDPILDRLRKRFPGLSKTQAGDTVFARQLRGEFDVSLALYHDQGLAPLKTIDFDDSVNVTLGLKHVRTSPDHGTAFGIAGQGKANPRSFANAVAVARRLVEIRGS